MQDCYGCIEITNELHIMLNHYHGMLTSQGFDQIGGAGSLLIG